jgi:NAD-dependent dihydropyrimidine dehydrogenase PreA subunit
MIREVVRRDEDLCDGCGQCVTGCHEGALQIIDGKARLISELMCDGLGACIGHCPQGAITIEKREAEPYDETKVMETMVPKGRNTVAAHLKHLSDHNETELLKEALAYLNENGKDLTFAVSDVIPVREGVAASMAVHNAGQGGGCPGSRAVSIDRPAGLFEGDVLYGRSELKEWPVQMHLLNVNAPYFRNSDLLLAADCTAFAMGDFHKYLKGKSIAIACPKLDSGKEQYVEKITGLIDIAMINTITIMIMQVPCCRGLLQLVMAAKSAAKRNVPVKVMLSA